MEMKKEIKRELNQTILRIESDGSYREDYQIKMLQENQIPSILSISGHGTEEKSVYEYEIGGKISLTQRYSKKKIGAKEMKKFLDVVITLVEDLKEYMLDPDGLILDPEYIFWEKGEYYFCYVPDGKEEIHIAFHKLMDYFVQWTDYQDVPAVKLAFMLHKETMEENYSLKKIVEEIKEQELQLKEKQKEKKQKEEREKEELFYAMGTYESAEHDWITQQEMGSQILRETDNMWTPVKRFLQKHKRPKWGDWDGIYVDESDLY